MARRSRLAELEVMAPLGERAERERRIVRLQTRMLSIQQAYLLQQRRAVLVFEGTDAAGKGGAIKRLVANLDPRFCKVWPIAAPTGDELRRHWLERFWGRLPGGGSIAVFDRSWYGRVLVERAERLIPRKAWERAYDEINTFERMLVDDGIMLVKLFLHISADEQRKRFLDRMADPHRRWKISPRDFEARRFAAAYRAAFEAMLDRTCTRQAPWHALPGAPKWEARAKVLETVVARLSDGVDLTPPALDPELVRLAERELGATAAAG